MEELTDGLTVPERYACFEKAQSCHVLRAQLWRLFHFFLDARGCV